MFEIKKTPSGWQLIFSLDFNEEHTKEQMQILGNKYVQVIKQLEIPSDDDEYVGFTPPLPIDLPLVTNLVYYIGHFDSIGNDHVECTIYHSVTRQELWASIKLEYFKQIDYVGPGLRFGVWTYNKDEIYIEEKSINVEITKDNLMLNWNGNKCIVDRMLGEVIGTRYFVKFPMGIKTITGKAKTELEAKLIVEEILGYKDL